MTTIQLKTQGYDTSDLELSYERLQAECLVNGEPPLPAVNWAFVAAVKAAGGTYNLVTGQFWFNGGKTNAHRVGGHLSGIQADL